jgi:cytochrome c553
MVAILLRRIALSVVVSLAQPTIAAHAASVGNSSHGAEIVKQVCSACHSLDGNSIIDGVPKVAAQYPEYIAKQLHAFRAEEKQKPHRFNSTMTPIAQALSGKDIEDVATYFSEQRPSVGDARPGSNSALGEHIYTKGNPETGLPACVTCHRPNGSGIGPDFPRLAGQRPEYVQAQLQEWQKTRGGKGKLMTLIVTFLQPKEISAVADYVTQLSGEPVHLSGMAAIRENAGRAVTRSNQAVSAGRAGRAIGN